MNVIHDLSSRIANALPVGSGARERALAVIQEIYPLTTLDEFEQAVGRYLAASPDIVTALLELVDGPTLASLANEVARDENLCSVNTPPPQAANCLLKALGAPTAVWNEYYRGVHRIRDRIQKERERLGLLRSSRRKPSSAQLNHFGIIVWKDVETLLKMCARFYYRALYESDQSALSRAFARLYRCKTLGRILRAIWDLEEAMDERARQHCYSWIERASPFQGLLDQPHDLDLIEKEPEWQEQYQRFSQELKNKLRQDYSGPYRFEVFQADVQVYRNFYPHENDDVVLAAGIDKAAQSFEAAMRMLNHMLSDRVAGGHLVPQLVLPVERGIDHLGREIVRLVTDSDLNDDGTYGDSVPVYRLAEWDKHLPEVQLFQFHLCCPVYELALNPVLIPLADIHPETLGEDE
jgi:hypothetical protein